MKQLFQRFGKVVTDVLTAKKAVTMESTLAVTGNATVGGTLDVTGATTVSTGDVTVTTGGLDVTSGAATFGGTVEVTGVTTVNELVENYTEASGDGAITARSGTVYITKAGVAVLTLADPVAGDSGKVLRIVAQTANAHTIDNSAGSGFNGAGAGGDFATLGGAIGDGLLLRAVETVWMIDSNINAVLN
jgi:hypothetical protein